MPSVLLYSGGLDSFIAWHYLGKPNCLYVNLSHRYSDKEILAMDKLMPKVQYKHSNYGAYYEKENAHIPGRNLLLSMYAAAEGYNKIYLVCQKGEQSIPDRSPEFFDQTSNILSFHYGQNIELINPFSHMTKVEMVGWYKEQSLSIPDLLSTISCYSDGFGQCGQCSSCFRRYVALTLNGIEDHFNGDIKQWGYDHYADRLEEYEDCRQEDLKMVLA